VVVFGFIIFPEKIIILIILTVIIFFEVITVPIIISARYVNPVYLIIFREDIVAAEIIVKRKNILFILNPDINLLII